MLIGLIICKKKKHITQEYSKILSCRDFTKILRVFRQFTSTLQAFKVESLKKLLLKESVKNVFLCYNSIASQRLGSLGDDYNSLMFKEALNELLD